MTEIKGKIARFDLRYTTSGDAVASGVLDDGTRLVFWQDLAEWIASTEPFLTKIYESDEVPEVTLEGYFKTRAWKDYEGKIRSVQEFTVKSVSSLDGRFYAQKPREVV